MNEKYFEYAVKLIIIFMILPIHEFAHAWMAHKQGDDTALYKGRLTLNPLVHIDPVGALCLFFTGFGWAKPVPVNPLRFKKQRKGMAITALAGPMSNFIVALIAMIFLRILSTTNFYATSLMGYITGQNNKFMIFIMLSYFITINIGLGLFNLIPIPPLDGSKILQYFTSYKFDAFVSRYQMQIYIVFFILLVSRVLTVPLSFVAGLIYNGMEFITNWIPALIG